MLFRHVCDLLEQLSAITTRFPPYLPKDAERRSANAIAEWFRAHRTRINAEPTVEPLLSTLLPECRTDRVYSLKEQSLEKIVARILGLSSGRCSDLARYKEPGAGDLADCVERVQKQVEQTHQSNDDITVEEIDKALVAIASHNQFSSPSIRALAAPGTFVDIPAILAGILHRLNARNAKWFVRLVLKNFSPVILPESLIFKSYHGLLPMMLKVQAELPAALSLLNEWKISRNGETDPFKRFRPVIGVKVGRQTFLKARSIKHCCDMAQDRQMSVEKKYDGEYCQIHIEMSKPPAHQIKIFSKSGKDSTNDRIRVHKSIRRALRLDDPNCSIRRQCIVEGELLVYNDKEERIDEFHKIRKHVNRSGLYIGTAQDSQRHDYEHLMIVFFDILMHDEQQILAMKQVDRRALLQSLIQITPGRAEIAESHLVNFSHHEAAGQLRELFTRSIIAHEEGMVMKPADDPYFNFDGGLGFKSTCIKMKKDYISTFGDVGDFAVVGASYDAIKAKEYNIPNMKWTHFWLGCMENKEAVVRWSETPRFVVVSIVSPNTTIAKSLMTHATPNPMSAQGNNTFKLRIEPGICEGQKLTTIFQEPLVFDMRCFAFDKEGNTGFWTLRFPQVSKLHLDRSFLDTVCFDELQKMAEKASMASATETEEEESHWLQRLQTADPHRVAVDASTQQTTQRTPSSTTTTPEKSSPLRLIVTANENNKFILAADKTAKRKSYIDNSPDFPRKRRCSVIRSRLSQTFHVNFHQISSPISTSLRGRKTRSQPLADITSKGSQASNSDRHPTIELVKDVTTRACKEHVPLSTPLETTTTSVLTPPNTIGLRKVHKAIDITRLSARSTCALLPSLLATAHSQTVDTPDPTPSSHSQLLALSTPLTPSPCSRFSNTLFYLSPCISSTPYISQTLLAAHSLIYTTNTIDFLSTKYPPCSLSNVQKHPRRILLVEAKRKKETYEFLKALGEENRNCSTASLPPARKEAGGTIEVGQKMRMRIEVYDWRILEEILDNDQVKADGRRNASTWRKWWVGCLT